MCKGMALEDMVLLDAAQGGTACRGTVLLDAARGGAAHKGVAFEDAALLVGNSAVAILEGTVPAAYGSRVDRATWTSGWAL